MCALVSLHLRKNYMRFELYCVFLGFLMCIFPLCLCVSADITDNDIDNREMLGDIKVSSAEIVEIKGEILKISKKAPSTWSSETKLSHVQCIKPGLGSPVPGSLVPQSVKVWHGDKLLQLGKDYLCDEEWGALGLGTQSCITSEDNVSVDYKFSLRRLDSLVMDSEGKKIIVKGKSHLTIPEPPVLNEGQKCLANIFVDYHSQGGDALILPIVEDSSFCRTETNCGRIPRTLAKIKAGQPVKVVCWGDSVTVGGEVQVGNRYATILEKKLKEKFPQSQIDMAVIAVGGSNSRQWLFPDEFPNPGCDFKKVIELRPDLVIIEFVNDSGIFSDISQFEGEYNDILTRLRNIGAEVILITPHFVKDMDRGKDTREYTANLKQFAEKKELALADASARWEHLRLEGLPYETRLINNINHPDDRGHIIFAEELMKCFE